MPRRRNAHRISDQQLAFSLAIAAPAKSRPPRAPQTQISAPLRDRPIPYIVRGIFRFTTGQERECIVRAVAPSSVSFASASAGLITRMRESGWYFAEGSAILTELLEATAKEE